VHAPSDGAFGAAEDFGRLLVSDAVVVDASSAGPDLGSDHLPVVATVHLDPKRSHRPSTENPPKE
jgi:hypothetical protein